MTILRNVSISLKLTVLMAVASTLALVLASSVFLYYDLSAYKSSLASGLATQARVIGANCSAALVFKDAGPATETLSSLRAQDDIRSAALYTPDGKLFASWGRSQDDLKTLPRKPGNEGVTAGHGHLVVFSTVHADKDVAGTLYIDTTLESWNQRRNQYTNFVGIMVAVGALLALVVGSRLQRIVSLPIQKLAASMRRVAKDQDYSHRAARTAGGEIGELTDGFNSMLIELEAHRNDLRHANEELETRVHQRTVQLQAEISERIGAEQRLEESRQALEEFFENATVGLLWIGPDGAILRTNQAELQTMGYPADEYVGRQFADFSLDPLAGREILNRLSAGQTVDDYEMTRICQDGSLRTVVINSNVLWNEQGEFVHARCFTRDITAIKEAQEAERARLEAERASSAKSEFLSRMSHELRTPMNAILGFAQLLQMDELEGDQKESVDQIRSAGEHLLRLINEVLDISRIEAGALTISQEAVSVNEVASEVKSLILPIANQRKIAVHLDLAGEESTHVMADRQRLCQVLLNLVSNAVKYNRHEGSVTISAESIGEADLRIRVTDTGIGIPAQRVHQIFLPFERLGAEDTTVEGTGLGLALSKRLVEAMDGSIGFDTGPQGTSFYIDLPLATSPLLQIDHPELEAVIDAPVRLQTPKSILLIEDNLSNVRLMERILGGKPNVKLLVAMQGTLGFELAFEHRPDMILLDLNLPDCHGYDLLKRLKSTEETADIPIVVVSADATQAQVSRLIAIGAHKYLTKPLDVRELLETLDEVLNSEDKKVA